MSNLYLNRGKHLFGHEKGDETLIKIANCLESVVKHYPISI